MGHLETAGPQAPATVPAPAGGGPATDLQEFDFGIGGMTCAACAARLQARLSKAGGAAASVNFATGRAHVTAPAGVTLDMLATAVEDAGYTVDLTAGAPGSGPSAEDALARSLGRRLAVAVALFIPLSDVSVLWSLFPAFRPGGWQWVLIALAAPVALWAAWPFHAAAARNARHGTLTMDTLVSLGITAACGWSLFAMFALDHGQGRVSPLGLLQHASGGGIYLEAAASVTTFLLAGRWYEARARRSAGDVMRALACAAPQEACLLTADGRERRVGAARLEPGQRFVVRPGERIAADGVVEFGQSAVDRSVMTGEPVPAEVAEGAGVAAGTVALTGRLVVRAVRVGRDTQLAHLTALVEQAQAGKAAIQRLADRICAVFVPAVLVAAVLTVAGWLLAGAPAERAASAGLAVLIIACPCALGLATPAALMVACGRGAKAGVFITRFAALESSRMIDTVVLDKTGTITAGEMSVTGVWPASGPEHTELLRYAGAVQAPSEHPAAVAVAAFARAAVGVLPSAAAFEALPGQGTRGIVDGRMVTAGHASLLGGPAMILPSGLAEQCECWEQEGRTIVIAGWDGQVRGAFAVSDTLKPSAPAAVAALHRLGLRTVLLTGDGEAAARTIAAGAGIPDVIAGAQPADKAAMIRDLRAGGRAVAMAGDGINDGPALASADLGIALGSGTDVAIGAADLILLTDDLMALPAAIALARSTFRTIRTNLVWAFCYNLVAIPVAAAGFLDPLIAGAAMAASSVFVVANSARLRNLPLPATAARRGGARRSAARPSGSQVTEEADVPCRG